MGDGDIKVWKAARSPNYKTNKNKLYPYSELPCLNEYNLIKIPIGAKDLIEHVDYFGRGRTVFNTGEIIGFSDCYNVNYQYTADYYGRKIANRIPISTETSILPTRNYIKDNSVLTVTIISKDNKLSMCIAQDIARIVNSDRGKVVTYGLNPEDNGMIAQELEMKQLFYCPNYSLPDHLRLTYSNYSTGFSAYLSMNKLKRELYKNVCTGNVEAAVKLTGSLNNVYCGNALGDIVNKLLENKIKNVILYAYKLWNNNYKDVVCKYFPAVFQQLFNDDYLAIINKHNQAMVLELKTTRVRQDGQYQSRHKLGWKITSIWEDDNVLFKLYNNESDMYLQVSPAAGTDGDRQACGSEDSKEDSKEPSLQSDKFYLKPIMINGQVAFTIYSCESGKLLELPADVDSSGDKAVVEQRGVGTDQGPAAGTDKDRQACGSEDSKEDSKEPSDKFYLKPIMINGQAAFTIISCESGKLLELPADVDSSGDKAVVVHTGVGTDQGGHAGWIIIASNQERGKDDKPAHSDDESDEYD